MAKCNEWPSEYQANWKKWPSAIITKFVYKVAKWINGQMQWLAKWILSNVEKVAKWNYDKICFLWPSAMFKWQCIDGQVQWVTKWILRKLAKKNRRISAHFQNLFFELSDSLSFLATKNWIVQTNSKAWKMQKGLKFFFVMLFSS